MVKIKKILLVTNIAILILMTHGCIDVISEFEHDNNIEIEINANDFKINCQKSINA